MILSQEKYYFKKNQIKNEHIVNTVVKETVKLSDKQETVVKRMTTDNCMLEHYEEWDEGEDKKWILTFRVLDDYEVTPNLN